MVAWWGDLLARSLYQSSLLLLEVLAGLLRKRNGARDAESSKPNALGVVLGYSRVGVRSQLKAFAHPAIPTLMFRLERNLFL